MPRTALSRPLTVLAVAALATGVLAGCAGGSGPLAGCAIQPGDASNAVTSTFDVGEKPDVEVPTPLYTKTAQASVIVAGTGAKVQPYDAVGVEVSQFDGKTGDLEGTTDYEGPLTHAYVRAGTDPTGGAIPQILACATVGSRIVLVAPDEAFTGAIEDPEALAGNVTVLVIDVLSSVRGKAEGMNVLPADGAPTIATAVDGTPGVSVLAQTPPTAVQSSLVKQGSGATVAEGDSILFQVRSWTWDASGVSLGQADSWAAGQVRPLVVDPEGGILPAEVIDAITGATVGSQVLVTVPGDNGSATIWLIDLLDVLASAE